MQRHQVLAYARLAGQVLRYHTWPVNRAQSVAEHSWQILRIWAQVFGPVPSDIANYVLWHDVGEIAVGDLPFPIKSHNPNLKGEIDRLEHQVLDNMGVVLPALSEQDKTRVKLCDVLEMYEYGLHEWNLGNYYAKPICDDTWVVVTGYLQKLPREDIERVKRYTDKLLRRD